MEFCKKCGSLKINGSCTNKKCDQHVKAMVETATAQQIDYIKELAEQLNEDISEMNFESMSKNDAADLIDDYVERLEDGDKKLVVSGDVLEDDDIESEDEDI
jgi:ribosomal protein L18E